MGYANVLSLSLRLVGSSRNYQDALKAQISCCETAKTGCTETCRPGTGAAEIKIHRCSML